MLNLPDTLELIAQTGHVEQVNMVAFSPSGDVLASASSDATVILWDLRSGKQARTLQGGPLGVYSLAFHPCQALLATGDSEIRIWDYKTGDMLGILPGHGEMVKNALAISPNGQLLACAEEGGIFVWDLSSGDQVYAFQEAGSRFSSIAFSPDGEKLAYTWNDMIMLQNIASPDGFDILMASTEDIQAIAFSPDGRLLASVGNILEAPYTTHHPITIWDLETSEFLVDLIGHPEFVWSVAFHPGGKFLASSDSGGQIGLWDLTSGTLTYLIQGHPDLVQSIAFSPDGVFLASASRDKTVKLWDFGSGRALRVLQSHAYRVNSVAFRSDGKALAIALDDSTVRLWDLQAGIEVYTLRGHSDYVNGISFSPTGNLLASASADHSVKLWRTDSLEEVGAFHGHTAWVNAVSFSPNGRILASAGGYPGEADEDNDCSVRLWDVSTREQLFCLSKHTSEVLDIAFHPDGRILASAGSDHMIVLWDTVAGKKLATLGIHDDLVYAIAFQPDGKVIASASWDTSEGGIIKLTDWRTGRVLATLSGHEESPASSLIFSPDGRFLLSGAHRDIKLWDLETLTEFLSFPAHTAHIAGLAFSPDGQLLASVSHDASTKLWKWSNQQELVKLVLTSDSDYVIATHANHYYSTKHAYKGVGFRVGCRVFPFEQFDLYLNRPDIVLETIGLSSEKRVLALRKVHRKRLNQMKMSKAALGVDLDLPEVTVASQTLPLATADKQLRFAVSAHDSKYLLDRLNVYVNDVAIYGMEGISLKNENTSVIETELELELSEGTNKIQVSVLNERGIESLRETFEVVYHGQAVQEDLFVAAIGVSRYSDSRYNLSYAAKDARDIAAFFEDQRGRFGEIRVLCLVDEQVQREKTLQVREFLMQARVDDLVILFLAGHGLLSDELDFYFATSDIDFTDPSRKGLSYAAIEKLVDGIPARKKLVLLDTCHSGEVDKENEELVELDDLEIGKMLARSFRHLVPAERQEHSELSDSFALLRELFADLRRGTGAIVISAAGGYDFAIESDEWRNGVFTYSLLEGLRSGRADLDRDGQILAGELRDYITERVQDLTGGRQRPVPRRENLEYDFRII